MVLIDIITGGSQTFGYAIEIAFSNKLYNVSYILTALFSVAFVLLSDFARSVSMVYIN